MQFKLTMYGPVPVGVRLQCPMWRLMYAATGVKEEQLQNMRFVRLSMNISGPVRDFVSLTSDLFQ